MATGTTRRGLGRRSAAVGGLGGRGAGAAERRAPRPARRGGGVAGAVALGRLGGAPWSGAGLRGRPPRGRDRRARPPGPDRTAADVGLWADRARTGGHPAGAA